MRKFKIALAAVAIQVLPMMVSAAGTDGPVRHHVLDRPFLELVGFLEGPDGYDDLTGFTDKRPVKPVTSMTINEVIDFQRMLRQAGEKSTAMGRYQFVYKTLLYLTETHGIDRGLLFDKAMQDRLTRLEMRRCGFYEIDTPIAELGNCLAHVWAALPLLTGPNRGESRYADTGINAAKTTPEVFEAILRNRFVADLPRETRPKKAGFVTSNEVFRGYGAPLRALPVSALAGSGPAPQKSLRPKARPERPVSPESCENCG